MSQVPALPPIAVQQNALAIPDKKRTIETRVYDLEKVNEALLEEIVRIQGELARRPAEQTGGWLESELRMMRAQIKRLTDKQEQLQNRVIGREQKSLEEEHTLTFLLQSSLDLEKKTKDNQQLMLRRRDQLETQLDYLQKGLTDMQLKWRSFQQQTELQLTEDSERVDKLIELVETQHREVLSAMGTLRVSVEGRERKLEDELARLQSSLFTLQRSHDLTNNKLSALTTQFLQQCNNCDHQNRIAADRVAKLRDDVKLLDGTVGDLNNKLNSVDSAARDRSSHLQAVLKSLQQWCREQYAHQSSMLVQCEEQLDNTKKAIQATLKECNSQTDKKCDTYYKRLKTELQDNLGVIQGRLQKEKAKVSQLMTQLHKSVEIVQKELDVTKEDINKVMFAEIASRLRELDGMKEQCGRLTEQLGQTRTDVVALVSQQCKQQVEQSCQAMLNEMNSLTDKHRLDMTEQVNQLHLQLTAEDNSLKSRLSNLAVTCNQLQQDSLVWQQEANNNISEIQVTLLPLTEQLQRLEEQVTLCKHDLSSKNDEDKSRKMQELQQQLSNCVARDSYEREISNCDQRLLSLEGRVHNGALHNTKLENALHKLELMLVQQVSMESKQRITSLQELKEQINLLQLQHPQVVRRTSSTTPVPATPTTRVRPHRKLHNRYRPSSRTTSPVVQLNETQGVFTSAPATPESQQNLIVLQAESSDHSALNQDQPSAATVKSTTDPADQNTSLTDQPADQHTSLTSLAVPHTSSNQHTPTDQDTSANQPTSSASPADQHTLADQDMLTDQQSSDQAHNQVDQHSLADQDTNEHIQTDQDTPTDQDASTDQHTPTDILLTDHHSSSDHDSENVTQP